MMSQSRYLVGGVHVVPTTRWILRVCIGILFLFCTDGCKIQRVQMRKDTGKNSKITVRQSSVTMSAVRHDGVCHINTPRPGEISGKGGWLQAGIALSTPRPELIQPLPWTLNYLYIGAEPCLTLPNAEVSYARS